MKINIFDYAEYHRYLKDFYEESKRINPTSFSYASLASKGGYLNEDMVFTIFNSMDTQLTLGDCIRLSIAIDHTAIEAEYFRCIVALSQASNEHEKNYFKEMKMRIIEENNTMIILLGKKQLKFYSEWYHSVVRALIGISSNRTFEQLGRKLLFPVSESRLQQSVKLLSHLGLIKKDKDGNYFIATKKNIKTGQEISLQQKKQFHLQYLKLAKEYLSLNCSEPEKVSSHIIGISEKNYEKICMYTDELKKRINALVENEENPNRVYLYQLIFVPLTKDCTTS
jgi:uncharacterized protein (TIGR02147 family)